MQSLKKSLSIDTFKDRLSQRLDAIPTTNYEPTGIQEDIIKAVGCGEYDIILVLSANKVGKTATAANILRNIIYPNDKTWFDYPVYNAWEDPETGKPFPKNIWITGTTENVREAGPIQSEIQTWWYKGDYMFQKGGKPYPSYFETTTGFKGRVFTYEQDRDKMEGPLIGLCWSDEPPRPEMIGAINSRFMRGGIWLLTMTPINCGAFLDEIEDLRQRGKRVLTLSCDITKNSITTGKPNSKGTKRGLMTDQEIERYAAGIPLAERDARLKGKASRKSGKIYPMFDRSVHVKEFNLDSDYAKGWNCYCIIDPHRKYYPFISWWAKTQDDKHICYNEWPRKDTLGGYYDEQRHNAICPYGVDMIASFIKTLDMVDSGLTMCGRTIDPRFARGTEDEFGKGETSGLVERFLEYGLKFDYPPFEMIEEQRDAIQKLLYYDPQRPICEYNEPGMYIMPHCVNVIRSFERHSWDDTEAAKESEKYKDPIDTVRYYLAYVNQKPYYNPGEKKKGLAKDLYSRTKKIISSVFDEMRAPAI